MRRILVIAAVMVAAGVVLVLGTGADDGDTGGDYKVRVIFDNAFSLIEGEDVRVGGVNVGKIEQLEVTPENRAAIVFSIKTPGFDDFRKDAQCTIRPQSLIGEKYVECSLTEPRAPGAPTPPPLDVIPEGQPGAGQRLLPVERTSKPVDVDLINNISRLPQRQRLAIIINELGGAFGGRAEDLNETIRRANPALGALNRVIAILGEQNQTLRDLASNGDRSLAPLARERGKVASFIVNANKVARATAERRTELERNFELLPRFLAELRPTMVRLGTFSDQFRPVLNDLRGAAPAVNRLFRAQGPFAQASIPAIRSLGETADVGRPALLRSKPIIDDIRRLTDEAAPLAKDLAELLVSLRDTSGVERLMDYIFYQAGAINGYDQFGHYLRAGLIVNTCSEYAVDPVGGCSAKFQQPASASARAATMDRGNILRTFGAGAGNADAFVGEDRSAQRRQGAAASQSGSGADRAAKPLKLPSVLLPGQDDTQVPDPADKGAAAPAGGAAAAQADGLLNYLLGDGA